MTTPSTTSFRAVLAAATSCGLFFFLSSVVVPVGANTIFENLIPMACVNPLLGEAGFCVGNNECRDACFGNSKRFQGDASPLSLETSALQDFYIPVDAVECDEIEDPICPAVNCCPGCRDELVALYRCIILEGNYHYLDYLTRTCPMDCKSDKPGNSLVPPAPAPTAPAPTEEPILATGITVVTVESDEVDISTIITVDNVEGDIISSSNETDDFFPSNETDIIDEVEPDIDEIDEVEPETTVEINSFAYIAPDWIIPTPVGSEYDPMTVRVGDTLTFAWSGGTHDVYIYPFGGCDRTDKIMVGSTRDNPVTYVFTEADKGKTLNFVCDIGSHCELGMRMQVRVFGAIPVLPQANEALVEEIANGMP